MDKSSKIVISVLGFLVALLIIVVVCLLCERKHHAHPQHRGYDAGRGDVTSDLPPAERDHILCPADAKLCPDRETYVSRTGPNCEFDPCPWTALSEETDPTNYVLPQQPEMDQRALDEQDL